MNSADDFRAAMRNWTSGVAIATSIVNGSAHGMTISSFTSVSAEPPMVTVSLAKHTRTLERVLESGVLGISVLSLDQQWMAERFAGKEGNLPDQFAGIKTFTLQSDVPMIDGGLAYFDCKLAHQYDMPSSILLVLTVLEIQIGHSQTALIYGDRKYGTVKFL